MLKISNEESKMLIREKTIYTSICIKSLNSEQVT